MSETIRVGLVGVGGIMNGVHIPGYKKAAGCEIAAICDIDPRKLETVGDRLGLGADRRFLHYEDMIGSGLVDAVDIATPDAVHCEVAACAVRHDLPFSVEKPMGMTYRQVNDVVKQAKAGGVPAAVCFSWHYNPYARKMREIVASGRLGRIFHVYIRCIKDSGLWEGRPLEWRFDKNQSASGVMGDLSSHMFDIARFIGNEFVSVSADAGIFIKERRALDSDEIKPVTTWDWCNVLARMENGVNATFQISRTAQFLSTWLQVEVYGEKGRLVFCVNEGQTSLEVQSDKGVVEFIRPDASYAANQSEAFLNIIRGATDGMEATLDEALKCQAVLDAAYRSVEEHRWVTIDEIVKEG